MKKILLLAVGLMLSAGLFAQAVKHTVEEGESIYGIARKYNVSPNEILRLNPSLGDGNHIEVGQKIVIPNKKLSTTQATTTTQPANKAVQPTQQTNTKPAQPATQQPQTTTESRPATTTTPQPQTTTKPSQESNNQTGYLNSGCKEMYRVQKKDNLYRVALLYNLTIEELCAANPPLTPDSKIKKGQLLCIPYSKAEKEAEAKRIAEEKAAAEAKRQAELAKQHKNHLKVAVILPMKNGNDLSNKMIEFYRGILMAADSVKRQGVSVDLYAYHSGSGATDMTYITTKPELKTMDVIFGPIEAAQAATLSEFCRQHKIRLVMPFSTTNSYGTTNPYVYHVSPNSDTSCKNGIELATSHFTNCSYVILQTGSSDSRGSKFTSELSSKLAKEGARTRLVSINADDDALAATLNQFRDNIIVPDASTQSMTAAVVKRLRNFQQNHPEFHISLLGYPEWPIQAASLGNDFHNLDAYAYTTFFRNPTERRVQNFEARYKKNFRHEISKTFPRYGLMGFDLGYYFMHGLSQLGDYFDENQSTLTYRPFQNNFNFEQSNSYSSHDNHQVVLVHYASGQRIEIIK